MVLDEPEFCIEAHILVHMAGGIVRFGAKDWADLVDALEHADHDLFIELRALCEIRWSAEVIEFEDIGTALCGRRDDLGRLDFREATSVERPAKARHTGCAQAEYRSPHEMPVADYRMIEQGGLGCLNFSFTERQRRRLLVRGANLRYGITQFQSPWGLRRTHYRSLNANDALDACFRCRQRSQVGFLLRHRLDYTPTVSDDQKGDASEATKRIEPPRYLHALA